MVPFAETPVNLRIMRKIELSDIVAIGDFIHAVYFNAIVLLYLYLKLAFQGKFSFI